MRHRPSLLLTFSVAVAAIPVLVAATPLEVGGPAPPLQIERLLQAPEGTQVTWESLRGKAVVLEFGSTWCAPCVAAIPHLNELARQLTGEPIRFITITDDDEKVMAGFSTSHPMGGWIGIDQDRSVFAAYQVDSLPFTVLVDRAGVIQAITEPRSLTENALRDLIAGRRPEVPPRRVPKDVMRELHTLQGTTPLLQALIRPATTTGGLMIISDEEFAAVGLPLKAAFIQAYAIHPARIVADRELLRAQYDFLVSVQGGSEVRDRVLRGAIEEALGVRTRREQREMEVLVLKASPDAAVRLRQSTKQATGSTARRGKIEASSLTMDGLASNLEGSVNRPVVDETGLPDSYDVLLTWDGQHPESIPDEARRQLGLELVPGKRTITVLVVEKAR